VQHGDACTAQWCFEQQCASHFADGLSGGSVTLIPSVQSHSNAMGQHEAHGITKLYILAMQVQSAVDIDQPLFQPAPLRDRLPLIQTLPPV